MPIQPGFGSVHVDGPLTNVSLAFTQSRDAFVADRVFQQVPVQKRSDVYFTYDRGYFNRDEMQLRAPGAESAGVTYEIGTDNYSADVWALHVNIADQIRAAADNPISLDREATELLTLKGLIRKEALWASNYFVTGVWTHELAGVSGAPGANQFQQFNEDASTPIEVVRERITTVHSSTGNRPNVGVMGREVFDALVDHPDIVGRLDRGQTTGAAMVMRQNLAALFELEEILIMDAIQNTAVEGATNAHSFIGGKNMLLAYRPSSPGVMTPAAGYTFTWTGLEGANALGGRMSRMRMEHLKSDRLEIEMAFDQKLVSADLGAFLLDAVA